MRLPQATIDSIFERAKALAARLSEASAVRLSTVRRDPVLARLHDAAEGGNEFARLSLIRLGWIRQTTNPLTGKAYRSNQRWLHEETGRIRYAKTQPGHTERTAKATKSGTGPTHDELHALADNVRHDHVSLSDQDVARARRSYRLLLAHHGHGALHRIKELMHHDIAAHDGAGEAERTRLQRRLAGFKFMLSWHQDEGQSRQQPRPTGIASVPTSSLHADPERFQYKLNVSGPAGVTEEFREVKRFRPEFAGVVLAWRDPADGKDYVVNGHHRYELAQRTGHPELSVHYIEAPNAIHARAIGALANIAEGRGTAVDAAKFMRDTGTTVDDFEREGISLRGAIARDAGVLARLADPLFRKVTLEQLSVPRALAIARELPSHQDQLLLAGYVEAQEGKGKKVLDREVEEMAGEIATAAGKTTQETADLFGSFTEEKSLFLERNQLKAAVRDALAREATVFKTVSNKKKAKTLEKGKNVLNVEENARIAAETARVKNAFDALANYKGELSDAINAAAEELFHNGRKRQQIVERLQDKARRLLLKHVGGAA